MEAIWTNVKDPEVRRALQVLAERVQQLASTDSAKGASLVSFIDTNSKYSGTDVQTALDDLSALLP